MRAFSWNEAERAGNIRAQLDMANVSRVFSCASEVVWAMKQNTSGQTKIEMIELLVDQLEHDLEKIREKVSQ